MTYDNQTSGAAYRNGSVSERDYCRQVVYLTIKKLGTCNDRQISEHLGWPINRITPRRGELVDKGKVLSVGKSIDSVTGRLVNYWKIPDKFEQLTIF